MCGNVFIATGLAVACGGETHSGADATSPCAADWREGLECRGPDHQGSSTVRCGPATLCFHGSLLQLRGRTPGASPLTDAAGNVLLFNGQVFGGSLAVPQGASDAQLLLQALGRPGADVPAVLSGLRGPWALAFWQAAARTLWFGRDPIGRRSLLLHLPRAADGRLMLASVAPLDPAVPFEGFAELPPGLYSLRLETEPAAAGEGSQGRGEEAAPAAAEASGLYSSSGSGDDGKLLARYAQHEWADEAVRQLTGFARAPELVEPPLAAAGSEAAAAAAAAAAGAAGTTAAVGAAAPNAAATAAAAAAAEAVGQEAQESDPAFEATVDAVLAALRQAVATRCRCIDKRQPADIAAGGGGAAATPPTTAAVGSSQVALERLQLNGCSSSGGGGAEAAQGARREPPPPPPLPLPPAPVLLLFSGGVDSTLLAALAHEALPPGVPIDLASVCFDGGASPDRLSALDALQELRQLAPQRAWRLLQVDCSLADVAAARPRLLRLLAPADTVMDLNIGAALWLAARGEGRLLSGQAEDERQQAQRADHDEQQQPDGMRRQDGAPAPAGRQPGEAPPPPPPPPSLSCCRSAARAVLLGHGADELCGGYGRHRTAFRARGWPGLDGELQLDLRRLWLRNLGRDDRLVTDHGREARHPFLDEAVVAACLAAPLHHLADLRLPPGTGDKRVLRACLRRLGLPRAAARAKRAIQFGSRLAAKTNTAEFGGTRRANLANAGSVRLADVRAHSVPAAVPPPA